MIIPYNAKIQDNTNPYKKIKSDGNPNVIKIKMNSLKII